MASEGSYDVAESYLLSHEPSYQPTSTQSPRLL